MRSNGTKLLVLALFCGTACVSPSGPPAAARVARAEAPPLELGYRLGVSYGDGTPVEDLPLPAGLFARYELDSVWSVGMAVDFLEGDFEDSAKQLDLAPAADTPEDESEVFTTQWTGWVERVLASHGPGAFFGRAGLGVAFVEVDEFEGQLAGGGDFEIETEAERELVALVGIGYRRQLSDTWRLDLTLQYERHFADWEIVDEVSGARDSIGDYDLYSVLVGIAYRF